MRRRSSADSAWRVSQLMCHTSASDEAVKLNIIELGLFAIVFLEGYFESDNVNGASFQPGAESCVTCASLTHIHTARAFERETSSSSPLPPALFILSSSILLMHHPRRRRATFSRLPHPWQRRRRLSASSLSSRSWLSFYRSTPSAVALSHLKPQLVPNIYYLND